jgi:hypothetical protein
LSTVTQIRIRAYNVGFGDCFLMTFSYGGQQTADRHVLIDCGSTEFPKKSGPGSIKAVAEKIKEHTRSAQHPAGKLHMVVVTHRHADHMSGFAGGAGAIIKALEPDLVVQPWTEDPDIAPDAVAPALRAGDERHAAMRVAARFGDMQAAASQVSRAGLRLAKSAGVPKSLAAVIHFLGETNIKNPDAVRNLISMPGRHVYAQFGAKLPIEDVLPGVDIEVLGPPTLDDWPQIAELASDDAEEYWHLSAGAAAIQARSGRPSALFPKARKSAVPQGARWLVPKIERMNADELLSIVRSIDDALNNTSLILLFDVGGKLLLFSGDAQIENWRYALFGQDKDRIRGRLAKTDVYKVGHHGSLNATPKTIWNAFERRGDPAAPGTLKTIVSTLASKHGTVENESEVPRRKLMVELAAHTTLLVTNKLYGKKTFWKDVVIDVP